MFLLAFGRMAAAQNHDDRRDQQQDQRRDQRQDDRDRHDQSQNRQGYDRQNHDRFDDHDRQITREWYDNHHDYRGFRDRDRMTPQYEDRFQNGAVLDRGMQRRMYPVPSDLGRRLPPAPRGYRYVVIGGHVVLIDSGYHVHDAIHLEMNIH